MTQPLPITKLATFTFATVPAAASFAGCIIRVSDGDEGDPCIAMSNGTDWLVIPLGSAISAS